MTRLVIIQTGDEIRSYVLMGNPLSPMRMHNAPVNLRAGIANGVRSALSQSNWEELIKQGARLGRLLGPALDFLKAGGGAGTDLSPDLTLELNETAASLPWELVTVRGAPLLERFRCGRQIVIDEGKWGVGQIVRRAPLTAPVRVLLVVDTSLDWAAKETEELDRRLKQDPRFALPSVLRNPDPEVLVAHLEEKDIVHFAGHSEASDIDPRRNGWKLKGGVFSPAYVEATHLDRWPALVFASACPTTDAIHMVADPIALAMLINGVGHYISTFSPITDSQLAASFALKLYEGLLQGEPIGAAMNAVRHELAWRDTNPPTRDIEGSIAAAHYVLYGNPSERVFEASLVLPPLQQQAHQVGPYTVLAPAGDSPARSFYRAQLGGEEEVLLAVIRGCPPGEGAALLTGLSELENRLRASSRLVPLLACGRDNDDVFVAQPVRSRVLDVSAQRSEDEARQILQELVAAVQESHAQGLRHGELRPDVFEQDPTSEQWRLRDAGWAEFRERHRLIGGTVADAYRSPEQWASAVVRIDVGSDLWAVAVIGYQLFVGSHPFGDARSADGDWKDAVTRGGPDTAGFPNDLAELFRRALARDLTTRFRTADEFLEALRRPAASGGFEPDLNGAIAAGGGVFFVGTADEVDTLARLRSIAAARGMVFRTWSVTSGIVGSGHVGAAGAVSPPMDALEWLAEQPQPTLLAALDFDAYLDDWQLAMLPQQSAAAFEVFREFESGAGDGLSMNFHSTVSAPDRSHEASESAVALPKAELRRRVIELTRRNASGGLGAHALVLVGSGFVIPEDLQKHVQVFRTRPATRDDVYTVLREERAAGEPWAEKFAWYGAGLTVSAVRDVVRLARVRYGGLTDAVIAELLREKSQVVRRSGLLEFVQSDVTLARDVVGVHAFRWWAALHRAALSDPVSAGILPAPQGVVLGGLVGTGKSLCARAIAGELEWPLLRLDVGRIFTSLLGGAEENLRQALAMAEAMGPVVLLVDDLDRALGHGQHGGVSGRVMHTLLTWMQERDRGVFLAATISDPTALPLEVLRAGRFDRIFFFDLPDTTERRELVAHCLQRNGRNPALHSSDAAAVATAWLSHADIAGRVEAALFTAAAAGRLDPTQDELLAALRSPEVSDQKKREIERSRRLWDGVTRASEPESPALEI